MCSGRVDSTETRGFAGGDAVEGGGDAVMKGAGAILETVGTGERADCRFGP